MKIRKQELMEMIDKAVASIVLERKSRKSDEDLNEARKTMKLGGGGRFGKLVQQLKAKSTDDLDEGYGEDVDEYHIKDPAALAASIGRKKYGKEKFQKMAAAGRRRHSSKEDLDERMASLEERIRGLEEALTDTTDDE